MRKLILSLLMCLSSLLTAQQLYNRRTDDMNMLYYSNAHAYIVPHLARCYQRTWRYYQDFWNYRSEEPTNVFIEDFSDWANGGATAVPHNFVYISMSPYMYVFEVAPASERMSLLMHHELTHVVAMDMYSSGDRFWRHAFGSKIQQVPENPISLLYAYLASPRKFSPRWYHEGIAVNMETWMSGGIGRAMGSYDEMVFRSMVLADEHIYDMVGLEAEGTAIDFQVGANSYLYGTRFFSYLAWKYGPKELVQWVTRNNGSKAYFSQQFTQVYQQPLTSAWRDWIAFEKDFQARNLATIRQHPVTAFSPITQDAMGSVSRSYFDASRRTLYTAVKSPGELPHIAAINVDSGEKQKICTIKGASTYYTTSLVWDQQHNRLFYTTDNFYRRDLNVVDIASRTSRRLITDLRAGELALNQADGSLWGVRHENGISTLIRLEAPFTDWTAIHAFPYGTDCYDVDISPDGSKLSAAITHIDGSQELALFSTASLLSGDASYSRIFDFDYSSPANFVFSDDGRYLYGTSYYTGVSNVFRYDFAADDMSIVSNCETGMFRPVPIAADSLIAFRYMGGAGWMPGFIPNQPLDAASAITHLGQEVIDKYPYVKEWGDGSPAAVNLDSLTTYKGAYQMARNIELYGAYPIVQGYKDYAAWGYHLNWQDAIGFLRFGLDASYSPIASLPEEERLHLRGELKYKNYTLRGGYNQADFYDLFGPTKTSRKGYSYGIGYRKSLIYDTPRTLDLALDADGFGGLEILPDYQNVTAGYDEMYQAKASLDYRFVQKSLGAVDDEHGTKCSLTATSALVNEELYPAATLQADAGLALPLHHSSIWLRNAAGYHFSDANDNFSQFYFGGFGNNWIDRGEVKRYRCISSFPGLEINQVGGRRFAKSLLELNLPPLRFRRVGGPALYARWLRPALFGGALVSDAPSLERQWHYTAGMQIDLRLISLSLLKTTLSFGAAAAWDDDFNRNEELMISLKIF